MPVANPKELFDQGLAQAIIAAQVMFPSRDKAIEQAISVVKAGDIMKTQDDFYELQSGATGDTPQKLRHPDKLCACADAKEHHGYCVHSLAVLLYQRAREHALKGMGMTKPLPAPPAVAELFGDTDSPADAGEIDPGPGFMDPAPDDVTDTEETEFIAEYTAITREAVQTAQDAPATPTELIEQAAHVIQRSDEPHSLTVKALSPDGFEVMLCIRGHDLNTVLKQAASAMSTMKKSRFRGTFGPAPAESAAAAGTPLPTIPLPEPAQTPDAPARPAVPDMTQPPAEASPEETGYCSHHKVQMRNSDRGYWHRVGEGKSCQGYWCEQHNERLWKNNKNGRTWLSHKLPDGTYCNPAKSA